MTPRLAIMAAGGRYSQWMRAMRNEDLPLRVFDLWLGSDKDIPVSTSTQFGLGAERWVSDDRFLRIEGYHKTLRSIGRAGEHGRSAHSAISASLLRRSVVWRGFLSAATRSERLQWLDRLQLRRHRARTQRRVVLAATIGVTTRTS